jgi:hypothetical protein
LPLIFIELRLIKLPVTNLPSSICHRQHYQVPRNGGHHPRSTLLGQTLPWVSGKRLFQYPEERSGFELPLAYTAQFNSEKVIRRQRTIDSTPITRSTSSSTSTSDRDIESPGVSRTKSRADTMPYSQGRSRPSSSLPWNARRPLLLCLSRPAMASS